MAKADPVSKTWYNFKFNYDSGSAWVELMHIKRASM
jgi:hypothetical protein